MEYETEIKILTYERRAIVDLFCKPSASIGDWVEIVDQVRLTYTGSITRKTVGLPEIANFTLTFGSGVTAGVIAAWLYDRLKLKETKVEIVTIGGIIINSIGDKEELTEVIEKQAIIKK